MRTIDECKQKVKNGGEVTRQEAIELYDAPLETLCAAADEIRRHFCGDGFDICTIINGKSGRCSENCKFCAQSAYYNTETKEYSLLDTEEIVYNIGNEEGKVSIRELAEIMVGIYPERNLKLVFDIPEGGTKGTAPFTLGILSSRKLRKAGWDPRYTVKEGFARTLRYLELEHVD